MVTVPEVVGCQVMVKGVPTGTTLFKPGSEMGLPDGESPTG